ncbi:thiamine phosphate synthase [Aurantiacibacter poecillastricola]|uniref:thiamine phosphate synthase n=1 Tax=Aurantiacibacter poecillastricola TaxID=3064385 RepID=UPI00273DEF78|nr:thiamine phosphate synthase [Aurantiacibacter sp. 219JJ12-13]MDP5260779.1 thiamine phosphate synthase [Aurantiacibacter sp. 219JJ12-13]
MASFQPLPRLWLLSDERNDAVLAERLASFREPVGFVYRHYHLPPAERLARFDTLAAIARREGHVVILSDSTLTAREWGADGVYGAPLSLYPTRGDMLTIAAVHDMPEMAQANRAGADAAMLSPVFQTRSHPGAPVLGPTRFRTLARHAQMPVIALGGMNARTARRLGWARWAAIDGLS